MRNKTLKCFTILLALLAFAMPVLAQLPTTCSYVPGSKLLDVVAITGALSYSVTNATWTAGVATLTIGSNTLAVGNVVVVSGVSSKGGSTQSGFNGQVVVTAETSTSISYVLATNPGTFASSTGAFVMYPGLTYLGQCINGVVYQVPIYGTTSSASVAQPTVVSPASAFGQVQPLVCHAQYNYSTDGGGAPGTITLTNGCTLPVDAVVINAVMYVSSAVTSGGAANMSIGWGSAGNIQSLLAYTAKGSLGTGFLQSAIVPQTAAGFIHVGTAAAITVTSQTTALNGGVVDIYVYYILMPV